MILNDEYLYVKSGLVLDDEFDNAVAVGNDMLNFAKKNKYYCLSGNQIGYNKQVCVVKDDDGYDIYINPELEEVNIEDSMVSISQETSDFPANVISLPTKRVIIPMQEKVKIDVFSVQNNERVSFMIDGLLSKIWQTSIYILNGIDKASIVESDFMTIKGKQKKKPNVKCVGCGNKNKRCSCD